MKKFLLPLFLFAILSIAACGDDKDEPLAPVVPEQPGGNDNTDDDPDTPTPGGNGRYLVLYASRTSNTERVAQLIQSTLDCDILEVEPETPYDNDYNTMLERAQKELADIREGIFPPIKTLVDSLEKYDIIFVGYPIWYGSMATPMQTFLHSHATRLAGKRIALFATSGSSGISSSVSEARTLCPNAKIIDETLLLTSSTLSQMASRVPAWLEEIGASRVETDETDNLTPSSIKMNITINNRTITATMEDNAATRDLLSRLPLEVTLDDFNNTTEKIFHPNPPLNIDGVTRGFAPIAGDIAIYVPWNNIGIFCKNWSYNNDLIKIGHIDGNGIEVLAVEGNLKVKFERQ